MALLGFKAFLNSFLVWASPSQTSLRKALPEATWSCFWRRNLEIGGSEASWNYHWRWKSTLGRIQSYRKRICWVASTWCLSMAKWSYLWRPKIPNRWGSSLERKSRELAFRLLARVFICRAPPGCLTTRMFILIIQDELVGGPPLPTPKKKKEFESKLGWVFKVLGRSNIFDKLFS